MSGRRRKMWQEQDCTPDDMQILLCLLLRRYGGRIEVSYDEVHDARVFLQDYETQIVTYRNNTRLFDEGTVELRYRPRGVVQGQVVQAATASAAPGNERGDVR